MLGYEVRAAAEGGEGEVVVGVGCGHLGWVVGGDGGLDGRRWH